jgi:acyl-CoA reductase-like NAD-dependent aldehyde dehydrogenase
LKNEEKKKINEIKIDEIVKEDGINEGVVNVIKGYGKKEGEDI